MPPLEEIDHNIYDSAGREHPGLKRPWGEFGENGLELAANDPGRTRFDGKNPTRILGGDGGDCTGAMDAEGGESLEVGLNAGAASAVRTSDCQRDGDEGMVRAFDR
jgi:hypothetical protein